MFKFKGHFHYHRNLEFLTNVAKLEENYIQTSEYIQLLLTETNSKRDILAFTPQNVRLQQKNLVNVLIELKRQELCFLFQTMYVHIKGKFEIFLE